MKKTILLLAVTMLALGGFAHGFGRPHFGPHPVHFHHHRHHGLNGWAVAGTVIGAGIVGAALYDAVRPTVQVVQPAPVVVQPAPVVVQPAPVVVTQPVVVQPQAVTTVQNVWVEGRYIDQVQPNGTVVRVWQPGHYEQRTVVVQ